MLNPRQLVAVWLVIGLHATIDLVTLALPLDVEDQTLFLLGAPLSQASLIAIWMSLSSWRAYLRFPLAAVGLVGTWVVTLDLLQEFGAGDPQGAAWAAMFAVQAAIIIAFVAVGRTFHWLLSLVRGPRGSSPQHVSATYVLWSVASLCILTALLQAGMSQLGWTREVLTGSYFYFPSVFGFYNALGAVTILALVMKRKWCVAGAVAGVISAVLQGVSGPHLLTMLFGTDGNITAAKFMALTGSHAVCLALTLVPLRLVDCFGMPPRPKIVDAEVVEA